MDRMWINSILGESDKCYIPNILLLRLLCRRLPLGHRSEAHSNSHRYKAKRNTHKHMKDAHLSGHAALSPSRLTFLLRCAWGEGVLQLEGHYGWVRDVEGGQRAESQIWHVTWSKREDLRLIRFPISSMVLWLQNAGYGSEIRLRL